MEVPAVELDAIRRQLDTERNGLLHELEHVHERTARRGKAEQGGGASHHDDHMAEVAGEHYEREKDLLAEASLRGLLERVDNTLGKLESGSYGLCDLCGERIAKERLEALPSAALCLECQNLTE
ncbi:MAG: hypothetical protein COZ06_19260 [Armatimonadetes bacterium CG_4_10_14_3_um_filter_66_18]|nr:MAG: hypothetical protein AUJ96_13615 [Armatimonadetes bacterium CG2_30_66_41]PIU91963.1 MAG: hypothetical protein COS65_20255 [Armatimonadetes bacterium CG06_land_8_20_14_3_00_66_21]PIW13571.1 MAG: hypothetical protein COW34_08830 [Armatimonadetes bacterium CG17_big_fil_post_rev_8_21_14_2_50_66_6]PIX39345.1 MAG: hypothetical protein COZ57_28405 [Armatimonadetes bacterium CG_4_8_14_3_um_filter_66_20]PIY45410.1 MAG: hypothetical protein COZ06_19260 [Armatimonadetes bacterium CG_4_10_14_3_um_f